MPKTLALYNQYQQVFQRIADVKYAAAVLQWDQETYLPKKGAESRARQLATLNELAHELITAHAIGNLLQELLAADLSDDQAKNANLSLEDYNRLKKLPADFVRTLSEAISASFYAWMDSRKQNSFKVFEPVFAAIGSAKTARGRIPWLRRASL